MDLIPRRSKDTDQVMKSPQYFVQEVELSIDPNIEDLDFGGAALDCEVDDTPIYNEELGALEFETRVVLDFLRYEGDLRDSRGGSDEQIGEATAEVKIIIKGDESEFQNYMRTWEEEGYRDVNWDFRYLVESGYLTEVIAPLGHIVDDSFRGVLPGLAFTESPDLESEISNSEVGDINDSVE